MPIDPDMEPIIADLEAQIASVNTRIDNLETGGADPLVDAYRELSSAIEDIQEGLDRDQAVQVILAAAARVRG